MGGLREGPGGRGSVFRGRDRRPLAKGPVNRKDIRRAEGHLDPYCWVDAFDFTRDSDDIPDPVTPWQEQEHANGSAFEMEDGRIAYVWADGGTIRLGFALGPTAFFGENGSVAEERLLIEDVWLPGCSVTKVGDRVMLVAAWASKGGDNRAAVELYELSGDDLESQEHVATLQSVTHDGSTLIIRHRDCGQIFPAADGSWVVPAVQWGNLFGRVGSRSAVYRSTDGGQSWSTVLVAGYGIIGGVYNNGLSRSIAQVGGELYWGLHGNYGGIGNRLYRSVNNGASWSRIAEDVSGVWRFGLFQDDLYPNELSTVTEDGSATGRLLTSQRPAIARSYAGESWEYGGGRWPRIRMDSVLVARVAGVQTAFTHGWIVPLEPVGREVEWRGVEMLDQSGREWCLLVDRDGRVQTRRDEIIRRFAFAAERDDSGEEIGIAPGDGSGGLDFRAGTRLSGRVPVWNGDADQHEYRQPVDEVVAVQSDDPADDRGLFDGFFWVDTSRG